MTHYDCDICIIGGGPRGLSLVSGAAQIGATIVLLSNTLMSTDYFSSG